ncbi:MAG: hypothetical protein Q9170_006724 [Blastenia crenularia]
MTSSMADEYLWSQIEPAAAVLCACLVTYRPLFKNVDFSILTKFSSLFSLSRHDSIASSNDDDDDPEKRLQYRWPAARGIHNSLTYQDMFAKVTKHGVHVVETKPAGFGSNTPCKAERLDKSRSAAPSAR